MIQVRALTESDMQQAIELKILCWTEELAGKADNTLSHAQELESWIEWMNSAEQNDDVRLLIGAFEDDEMLGVAFCSFAETSDIPSDGIELNGLWVYPKHRNRGVSLKLLHETIEFYESKAMKSMVIYNHHDAPSNAFYQKLGCQRIHQTPQMNGQILVDIFIVDLQILKREIENRMTKSI